MNNLSLHAKQESALQIAAMTEQRHHHRSTSEFYAEFTLDHSPTLHSVVRNISLGGAWLDMLESRPEVGREGRLHAEIGGIHLYMIAKVVRHAKNGIGVTFIDMGIETYQQLKQLIEEISAENE